MAVNQIPYIGQRFDNYGEVKILMKNYGDSISELFTKRSSKKIPQQNTTIKNKTLEFIYILFTCKYGGKKYKHKKIKNERINTR